MALASALQGRLRIGFATALFLTLCIGGVSILALRFVIGAKDDVISQHTQKLIAVQELRLASERDVSDSRAYLLTGDRQFLHRMLSDRREFRSILESMQHVPGAGDSGPVLERIRIAHDRYVAAADEAVILKQKWKDVESLGEYLERQVLPEWGALRALSDTYLAEEESELIRATAAAVFILGWRTLRSLDWAERQLRALNEDLEVRVRECTARLDESVRELESYSYTVAHDLRAPLRAITAFSQLLLEDCAGKDCATCRDFKRRIEESARRVDRLILDLLAYSRLSRQDFQIQPLPLAPIVERAGHSQEAALRDREGSLKVEGPFPVVMGQEVLLLQVLENLVSNAVKFVAPGVRPQVTIRADQGDGTVRVWVEDNGIGIPAEYHDRIFGIFERLNRTEDFPGTGIGLAIVRRAVHRMGGRAGFESEPGRGSLFWIELQAPPD